MQFGDSRDRANLQRLEWNKVAASKSSLLEDFYEHPILLSRIKRVINSFLSKCDIFQSSSYPILVMVKFYS